MGSKQGKRLFCFLVLGCIAQVLPAQNKLSLFDEDEFTCTYFVKSMNGKVVTPGIFVDVPDSIMIAAAASNVGGKRIYFSFRVKKDIDKQNGWLPTGPVLGNSKMRFYLTDGQIITLISAGYSDDLEAFSKYKKDKTYTISSIHCRINEADLEKLKNSELLKLEVEWSERTVGYPVMDKKIFINQVPCIQKKVSR